MSLANGLYGISTRNSRDDPRGGLGRRRRRSGPADTRSGGERRAGQQCGPPGSRGRRSRERRPKGRGARRLPAQAGLHRRLAAGQQPGLRVRLAAVAAPVHGGQLRRRRAQQPRRAHQLPRRVRAAAAGVRQPADRGDQVGVARQPGRPADVRRGPGRHGAGCGQGVRWRAPGNGRPQGGRCRGRERQGRPLAHRAASRRRDGDRSRRAVAEGLSRPDAGAADSHRQRRGHCARPTEPDDGRSARPRLHPGRAGPARRIRPPGRRMPRSTTRRTP